MGCSNSKEVTLTAAQTSKVRALANDTLEKSEYFKNVARTVLPSMPQGMSPAEVLADTKPFYSYFEDRGVPPFIRDENQSFSDLYGQMQNFMQSESKKQLMPELLREYPKANKNQKIREQCERDLRDASSEELSAAARKFIESVQNGQGGAVPRELLIEQEVVVEEPVVIDETQDVQGKDQGEVILPVGKWEVARGTPFYWSEEEKLFFHPPSGQFYDPNTEKWYDPDQDEWYSEE